MRLSESPLTEQPMPTQAKLDIRCPRCEVRTGTVIIDTAGRMQCSFCSAPLDPQRPHTWTP